MRSGSRLTERVFDYAAAAGGGTWSLVEPGLGPHGRRDIWLLSDGRLWRVRGRLGGDGGQEVSYNFSDEASARSMVDRLMKTSAGTWSDLTGAVRQEANRRKAH